MTNVKLKLMFFLLNSLLTADVVQARPYSDNTTDIVIKISNNNNTFNIPVEPDSDTLVVANDEVESRNEEIRNEEIRNEESRNEGIRNEERINEEIRNEEMRNEQMRHVERRNEEMRKEEIRNEERRNEQRRNKENEENLASMMNAEQDRDEVMSEMKDYSVLVQDKDAAAMRKNISNPSLHEMINSETDRDESLTDLRFRPEAEFAEDMPRFEFLIAARINESDANRNAKDNGLYKDKDRNSSDVLRKVDYVELVEVMRPKSSENKSAYFANITGHEVDNDLAPDTSFTDLQTLFLACFGTLLPLLAVLFATLLIRCMCRRWCPGFCKKPQGSSVSESSEKQDQNHQQLKSPTDESADGGESPPANGSIFTMTLKNNHLIVETEERNDITKNGRETKMKYSPDNDGIFVVEVQQSAAYRPTNKSIQNSPPNDPQISTNQALIHRVPEEVEKNIEDSEKSNEKFENQKALALSSTGLSISDLSMSSIGSHNVSYSYGSQMGYEQGPFGYPVYAGYDTKDDIPDGIVCDNSQEPLISKTPTDPDKPVVTAAIFKQDSIIGNDALQGPGYCIEGSTDGPLLSDVQAREYSLQHLHDQKGNKIENGVAVPISEKIDSPKKTLNRADSLPVRLEEEKIPEAVIEKNNCMETINEDDVAKDALKGKRASLPIIRTDMYETVKDAILPSGSPKFEKLTNETSPREGSFDSPPMITITEESESGKSDSTS